MLLEVEEIQETIRAWEGERTVTFVMEDALMSPLGFAILSGAGNNRQLQIQKINVHTTATVAATVELLRVSVDFNRCYTRREEL